MRIVVLTLFPRMFDSPFAYSIMRRAQEKKLVDIEYVDIRSFAKDKYQSVDDRPYGGGTGMVMRIDVISAALSEIKKRIPEKESVHTVLLDPAGSIFNQAQAREFSKIDNLILLCGHYEGVDARVYNLVDERLSIGKYVLTGGELPAMVIIDAVTRLIPGVLSKPNATEEESFSQDYYLEYPQYTRPQEYEGEKVPEVLIQGDHKKIKEWKEKHAKKINPTE